MITIIVAVDLNNGIGYRNGLLTYLPGDLPRFKKITMGHSLIMGRKTWDSIPRRPLPGRRNIVLSRSKTFQPEGAEVVSSLKEALTLCASEAELFIIGGGELFRQTMAIADKLLVTHINARYEADTFFPEISGDEWYQSDREDVISEEPGQVSFSYVTYLRRRGR